MRSFRNVLMLSLSALLLGCSSHGSLKSELDGYQPSRYYEANIQAPYNEHISKTPTTMLNSGLDEGIELLM